jgi:hypothetical protein
MRTYMIEHRTTRLGADAHGRALFGARGLGGPWRGTSLALAASREHTNCRASC